jgi:hypothetical protein
LPFLWRRLLLLEKVLEQNLRLDAADMRLVGCSCFPIDKSDREKAKNEQVLLVVVRSKTIFYMVSMTTTEKSGNNFTKNVF